METIRILLADDHDLVRAGLRALLERIPGFEVVAEAADGRAALRMIHEHRPDLVLMDIMMPELNGLEATARASRKSPHTRVLVLSMNASPEIVLQALQSGAAGYLLKSVSPAELETAIKAVARGEAYLSTAISQYVIDRCLERAGSVASTFEQLTSRQREVLQLIAEGNTTKAIAKKLSLSAKTIETYRKELMDALDIHDVAGLTRYAIRIGLVSPDS